MPPFGGAPSKPWASLPKQYHDHLKHAQHSNNQVQRTRNTDQQPRATLCALKSPPWSQDGISDAASSEAGHQVRCKRYFHREWYLLPAAEKLPGWWSPLIPSDREEVERPEGCSRLTSRCAWGRGDPWQRSSITASRVPKPASTQLPGTAWEKVKNPPQRNLPCRKRPIVSRIRPFPLGLSCGHRHQGRWEPGAGVGSWEAGQGGGGGEGMGTCPPHHRRGGAEKVSKGRNT